MTVSGWQRVGDNAIPARGKISGSYVNAAFAAEDAHAGGYDDALLLTADGHLAEASAANVFVVRDREVATPPLADDVLNGIDATAQITRRNADIKVIILSMHADESYIRDQRPGVGTYTLGYYPHNYDFLSFAASMIGRSAQALDAADRMAALVKPEMLGALGLFAVFAIGLAVLVT